MGVLTGLEPQRVFDYFEEISRIPHGSGNEKAISDYLAAFAKEHGFVWYQDASYNVIIIKEASEGYEDAAPIILQGHMDMVAVKDPDCAIDLEHDGLALAVDWNTVYAKGTSLGGDDGIALACFLAILEDEELAHPRLEAVFTTSEEIGMYGAAAIDLSMLKGRRLINMDSEEEGIFTVGCAGGARVHSVIPMVRTAREGVCAKIRIHGLQGGHSGVEIHKQRGNANCLMGRLLCELSQETDFALYRLSGGTKDNAIALESDAEIVIAPKETEALAAFVRRFEQTIQKELINTDEGVRVSLRFEESVSESAVYEALDEPSTRKAAEFLFVTPNGVQAMSSDIEGLVETSLNLGILRLTEQGLELDQSIRSSSASAKEALREKLTALAHLAGGSVTCAGDYPAWEYRQDSPLRDAMTAQYREMFGEEPKAVVIHAGLECGILSSKLEDLDCVSFGPDLTDIHTTSERMHISSVGRMYEYLRAVIQNA